MTHHDAIRTAEQQWAANSEKARRTTGVQTGIAVFVNGATVVAVALLANAVASGPAVYLIMAVAMTVLLAPFAYVMWRQNVDQQDRNHVLASNLERQLTDAVEAAELESEHRAVQVRRQDFEARLANALEMAQDEGEVLGAVERALHATLPDEPAELLLADNSHAHLIRMAESTPTGEPPGCSVDSPDHCPAARRAQVQQFTDSDALDSCPKLRDRARGRCSAVCVPVSIMGRTVGVIHATGDPGTVVADATVTDLATLSKLAGARIGLLRVMAETELQAATDSLTGLLNRRSLENRIRVLRAANTSLVVAMADLDHFKQLNDTHGHETGDKALRLFAQVLRSSLRTDDLVSRYGGEEFALVLPSCTLDEARTILDEVRAALESAAANAGLPHFTASFGVVHAGDEDTDLADVLARADAALFGAKRAGRDRVVVHGADGQPVAEPLRHHDAISPANGNGRPPRPSEELRPQAATTG